MSINALGAKMQAAGFDFVPQSYTHDFVPLANGHLVVLVNYSKNFTDLPGYPGSLAVVGDGIVDLDQNGSRLGMEQLRLHWKGPRYQPAFERLARLDPQQRSPLFSLRWQPAYLDAPSVVGSEDRL